MPRRLRVYVDRDKCVGAAMCVAIGSAIFELDSEGKARLRLEIVDDYDRMLRAAEECPASAIILEDPDTSERLFPNE